MAQALSIGDDERVEVVRRSGCAGVHMVQVFESTRVWSHVIGAFCFSTAWDWSGNIGYRRRQLSLRKGETFLFEPGEFYAAEPFGGKPGSFRVVEVEVDTLEALCRAEGHRGSLHFSHATTNATAAPPLAAALSAFERAFLSDAEPLDLQSRVAVLAHAALSSVLESTPRRQRFPAVPRACCERLRDALHSTEGAQLNLVDFAQQAGVSQYQLLRAFKRRYGAPPHAYGLHVRIERARQMLHRGYSATDAAAANDFTDQSHFTRHFRRVWRMPPGQYVKRL